MDLSSYKTVERKIQANDLFQFWPPGATTSINNNFQIGPPDGTTCISSKYGHQIAPLALVTNLITRWRPLH